jgi:hypothetical protein
MGGVADEIAVGFTDAAVDELAEERSPWSRDGDGDFPFRS